MKVELNLINNRGDIYTYKEEIRCEDANEYISGYAYKNKEPSERSDLPLANYLKKYLLEIGDEWSIASGGFLLENMTLEDLDITCGDWRLFYFNNVTFVNCITPPNPQIPGCSFVNYESDYEQDPLTPTSQVDNMDHVANMLQALSVMKD